MELVLYTKPYEPGYNSSDPFLRIGQNVSKSTVVANIVAVPDAPA